MMLATLQLEGGQEVVVRLYTPAQIERALAFMVRQESRYLRRHPWIPHPYDLPIRYQQEGFYSNGQPIEVWQRIATTISQGWGDCEDLAIYLAAWLRVRRRLPAMVRLVRYQQRGKVWYHAVVELRGRIFDPSKALGM